MINLIPTAYRQDLVREYWIRLGIVALFFVAGACLTGALFIMPSFFTVTLQERSLKVERVAQEENAVGNANSLETVLAQSDQKIAILAAKYTSPALTDLMSSIIQKKPAGVILEGIRYERAQNKGETLVLSGTSATRDALVLFQEALRKEPRIANVQLPISDLASSANISFTLTATLAPTP